MRKKDYVYENMAQQAARNETNNMLRLFALVNETPALHHLYLPLVTILNYKGFMMIGKVSVDLLDGVLSSFSYAATLQVPTADYGAVRRILGGTPRDDPLDSTLSNALNINPNSMTEKTPYCCQAGLDGRTYVLDFEHLLPPEVYSTGYYLCNTTHIPPSLTNQLFFFSHNRRNRIDKSRRMRPEFVRRYKRPLASLAYSNPLIAEGVSSELMVKQNREVKEATEYLLVTVSYSSSHNNNYYLSISHCTYFILLTQVIPEFAQSLVGEDPTQGEFLLVERMHRKGISCRYLGHIRTSYLSHATSEQTKGIDCTYFFAKVE